MSKLKKVVDIIEKNIGYFNSYYKNIIYSQNNIKLINLDNIEGSLNDALKLFYFSLTTRQRSPNDPLKPVTHREIEKTIRIALHTLNDTDLCIKQRYFLSMKELNDITGAGQKIITMFIKYLIHNSINLNNKIELQKILWVPLDVHLIKFLFTNIYNNNKKEFQETHRFKIFNAYVSQAKLQLSIDDEGEPKENELYYLQRVILDKFIKDKIKSPPIILDNLWVTGSTRCVYTKFSPLISCAECMFKGMYNKKRYICSKERV
jgi:hypothetical protein